MKLTSNELYQLVRCSEWLESGDDNPDPEQKKYDKLFKSWRRSYGSFMWKIKKGKLILL